MYIIEIMLKNTPMGLSVQKKEEADAKAAYTQLTEGIRSGNPVTIELTCDHQPGKMLCILTSEISSVQMSEKSGSGTASGKPPGFFVMS